MQKVGRLAFQSCIFLVARLGDPYRDMCILELPLWGRAEVLLYQVGQVLQEDQ